MNASKCNLKKVHIIGALISNAHSKIDSMYRVPIDDKEKF